MEKKKSKKVRLVIVAGGLLLLGLVGCAKQTSAPVETTVVESTVDPEEKFKIDKPIELEEPTKEVLGTDADGGKTGLTADGEIAYDSGPYGDLGKSTFDNLAGAWVKGNIPDEADLREIMDFTYGDFNNKEALTQEILAMPRNTQPAQVAKETEQAKTETKSQSQAQTQTATAPTKAETAQPVPQEPETGSYNITPEEQAEYDKFWQEAKEHPAQVGDGGTKTGTGPEWDYDSAASGWDWN